jgi:PAS domain S-box-containing protein
VTRTRILVVDDREENRRLVVKALEPLELVVDEASCATDAIATALERPPDVVVLDVQLPGEDGYSVCRALKADPRTRDAPVVLLTAVRRASEDAIAGFESGADDYLTKPIDPAELAARVRAWVRLKHALDELRRARSFSREIVENAGVPIVRVDRTGTVLLANAAAEEATGSAPGGLLGRQIFELAASDEARDRLRAALALFFGEGRPLRDLRFTLRPLGEPRGAGEARRILEVNASPVRGANGRREGAVLIARDITREEDLERRRQELVSAFVHDLRSPLNAVRLAARTVSRRAEMLDERGRRQLEVIRSSVDRLAVLVDSVLEAASLDRGAVPLNPADTDLSSLASEVVENLRPVAEERELELVVLSPAPVRIRADHSRLEQVIWNLVDNAIGYASRRVTVSIRSTARDELRPQGAEVTVEDDGPGVPQDEREAVFQPFHRGQRAGLRRGTGLGLAICRSVVDAHGGRIWIGDAPGGGAQFRFWIPARSEPATEKAVA